MAYVELSRPDVFYYSSEVIFNAYVYDLEPDEYVDYYFSVDEPQKISVVFQDICSGRYKFRIFDNSNLEITVTVLIYTYDVNLNKIIKEVLTDTKTLYPDTLETHYIFDVLPEPQYYDETYWYKNDLYFKELDLDFWRPDEKLFELPYYYPVIAKPSGGMAPYKITWKIIEDDNVTSKDYEMFYKHDICSLVFLKMQKYTLQVTVEDRQSTVLVKEIIIDAQPTEIMNDYVFDLPPEAQYYDDQFITYEPWKKYVKSRHTNAQYNYYLGKYNLDVVFPTGIDMSFYLKQVKDMINKEITPRQMWDRYYASEGYSFYSMVPRYDIYEYNKVNLLHLYIDDNNNLCYNLRLISSYDINSALNRIIQAMNWVCILNKIDMIKKEIRIRYDIKSTPYMDSVLDGMKSYLDSFIYTKYDKLELDDRYEAVQMDVESYLSRLHKYIY